MVKKGQMIGDHKLDASTSRPVAMASSNEQGVTTEMRDRAYRINNYNDSQLTVGSTVNVGLRTQGYYTVALVPTVVRHGK